MLKLVIHPGKVELNFKRLNRMLLIVALAPELHRMMLTRPGDTVRRAVLFIFTAHHIMHAHTQERCWDELFNT